MKKDEYEKWRAFFVIEAKQQLEGIVSHVMIQKKQFSSHYWYVELEASVYIPNEKQTLKVIWKQPLTEKEAITSTHPSTKTPTNGNGHSSEHTLEELPSLTKGMRITMVGERRNNVFYAQTIE